MDTGCVFEIVFWIGSSEMDDIVCIIRVQEKSLNIRRELNTWW